MDPTQPQTHPPVDVEQAVKEAVLKERMAKVRKAKKKPASKITFNATYLAITSVLGVSVFAMYYYRNRLKSLITTFNSKTVQPVQDVMEVPEVVEETKPDAVQYVDSVVRNLTNSITEIKEKLEQREQVQEEEPVVVRESPPVLTPEQVAVEEYLAKLRGE